MYPAVQMVLFTLFLPCSGIPHVSTSSLTLTPQPPHTPPSPSPSFLTITPIITLTPCPHSSPSLLTFTPHHHSHHHPHSLPSLLTFTPHPHSSPSPLLPLFAGKFLLMLQAIRRAHAIDRDRPELHEHIVDFCCRGNTANTARYRLIVALLIIVSSSDTVEPLYSGHHWGPPGCPV